MSPHGFADEQVKLKNEPTSDADESNNKPSPTKKNKMLQPIANGHHRPAKAPHGSPSPMGDDGEDKGTGEGEDEKKVGGDVTVKLEPGKQPKLSRSHSQKVAARPPQLFLDLPDRTDEACATFDKLEACTYSNKYLGYTEHAMECDCTEGWGMF